MDKKFDAPPDVAPARMDAPDHELPAYESRGSAKPLTDHLYTLDNTAGGKPKPWVLLKIKSKAPSPKSLPVFAEGESVNGTIELDIEKTEHIQAILLSLKGETLQVGQEPVVFTDETKTLWSVEMGDAKSVNSLVQPASGSKVKTGSPKLKGKYSWPFSVTFPREVQASSLLKGAKQPYPLPPSFSERASPAYIDYKLQVTIQRGRFRIDNTLATSLAYTTRKKAPKTSELRQAAYAENGQLAGPDADPEGWKVLETIKLSGTLFESRAVDVECTVAVGSPTVYALNSPIPLWITIKSSDTQALDLLGTPAAVGIRLRRSLAVGDDATDDKREERADGTTFGQDSGAAAIWPVQGSATSSADNVGDANMPNQRVLEGEIYVAPSLKTSFVFPRVSVRYFIDIMPFKAAGFVPKGEPTEKLFSQPVQVVTDHPDGAVVRSRAPPGYAHTQTANFDTTIGMLTAANQRFIHYHHHQG